MYQPAEASVLSVPLLPIEFYNSIMRTVKKNETVAGNKLNELISDEVKGSILITSPSLLTIIDKLDYGVNRKALRSVVRYLIRMATRADPFGALASVGCITWASESKIKINHNSIKHYFSIDLGWLIGFIYKLERENSVMKRLRFYSSENVLIRNGRLIVPDGNFLDEKFSGKRVSIKLLPPIAKIMKLTSCGEEYTSIDKVLRDSGLSSEKIFWLVKNLIMIGALHSELRFPVTHKYPLTYVIDTLKNKLGPMKITHKLETLRTKVEEIEKTPPNKWKQKLLDITETAEGIYHLQTDKPVVYANSYIELGDATLSTTVVREISKGIEILLMLSYSIKDPTGIESFQSKFISKYGEKRVPLLEVLDERIGIGRFEHPNVNNNNKNIYVSDVSEWLLNKTVDCLLTRKSAILINDNDLRALRVREREGMDFPPTIDVFVTIIANSLEDIDVGNFKVLIDSKVGKVPGGSSISRYIQYGNAILSRAYEEIIRFEESSRSNVAWVDAFFYPRNPRAANIMQYPSLSKWKLTWNFHEDFASEHPIRPSDILLEASNGKLRAIWAKSGKEIKVSWRSMLNPRLAPNALDLLANIGVDSIYQPLSFDFGVADSLTFLPRIEYGKIILRTAKWKIGKANSTFRDSCKRFETFKSEFDHWREQWMIPRLVYLVDGEQKLLIDLENDFHLNELRLLVEERQEGKSIELEEDLLSSGVHWVKGDLGHYLVKLFVPMKLSKSSILPRAIQFDSKILNIEPHKRLFPNQTKLNKNGLLLKLFCLQELQEEVLADLRKFVRKCREPHLYFFFRRDNTTVSVYFYNFREELLASLYTNISHIGEQLVAKGISDVFSVEPYRRKLEYNDFGNTELFETLSKIDSKIILETLAEYPGINLSDRILFSTTIINILLSEIGLTMTEKSLVYFAYKKTLNHIKCHVKSYIENYAGLALECARQNDLDKIIETSTNLKPLFEKIIKYKMLIRQFVKSLERVVLPHNSQTSISFFQSLIKSHCNRLFGSDEIFAKIMSIVLFRSFEIYKNYLQSKLPSI